MEEAKAKAAAAPKEVNMQTHNTVAVANTVKQYVLYVGNMLIVTCLVFLSKTMDDTTALDLLSSDFKAAAKPAAPVASSTATAKLEPPVLDSEPLKVPQKTK